MSETGEIKHEKANIKAKRRFERTWSDCSLDEPTPSSSGTESDSLNEKFSFDEKICSLMISNSK